jgi:hypothetical protein
VRRLVALLSLAFACGGESVLVPVTLSLDATSCTTDTPDLVAIACESQVGVWVKSGDPTAPDILEHACVSMPEVSTLADLPSVLEGVDLSGLAAGEVWLEVGVYAPSTDSCPPIEEFAEDMVAYGQTDVADISQTSRGLMLELACFAVDDGSTYEACSLQCTDDHDLCLEWGETWPCETPYDDCLNACAPEDDICLTGCDSDYDACIAGLALPCEAALDPCLTDCAGDIPCEDDCFLTYDTCVMTGCDTGQTQCLAQCDAGDESCAVVI